jgi:hypothetical protein
MSAEPQVGRVRSIYIDFSSVIKRLPVRGDRVSSGKSTYYVLHGRAMKTRSGALFRKRIENGCLFVRWKMAVIKFEDMPPGLNGRLLRSAIRRLDGSRLFEFRWYPRKRKAQTFEQYMGAR